MKISIIQIYCYLSLLLAGQALSAAGQSDTLNAHIQSTVPIAPVSTAQAVPQGGMMQPLSSGLPVVSYGSARNFAVNEQIDWSPTNSGGAATFSVTVEQTLTSGYYNPLNTASAADGTLYITNTGYHSILKRTVAGVQTVFAGGNSTAYGYVNGTGTVARFRHPSFLAVDGSGNIFVADQQNHRIRKITPAGVVTVFAGSGSIGSTNGTGTAASFNYPMGLAFDGSGNLYVADAYNHRIRKITPAGVVSTYAGSGTLGLQDGALLTARFNHPMGLIFDGNGDLYVTDRSNHAVRRISSGQVMTVAGNGTIGNVDGQGSAARFNYANNLVVENGNIYMVDMQNHSLRYISPSGYVTTVSTGGQFTNPYGISRTPDGKYHITENTSNRIKKVNIQPAYNISPALPNGLTFDRSTGKISGKLAEVTVSQNYTVTARNASGTATSILTFSVGGSSGGGSNFGSGDRNYILETVPKHPYKTIQAMAGKPVDSVNHHIQYYDGMGRTMQTIAWQVSPTKKDYISHHRPDTTGRLSVGFLPYSISNSNGAYRLQAETEQLSFYTLSGWETNKIVQNTAPFSVSKLHDGNGELVHESGSPGVAWQPTSPGLQGEVNNTVKQRSYLNSSESPLNNTQVVNSVARFKVTSSSSGNTLEVVGRYPNQTLVRQVTRNENLKSYNQNGRHETFKNKEGQILVERTVGRIDGNPRMFTTYYVYDDNGNLAYILPPAAEPDYLVPDIEALNKWCYQYRYNDRGLLIEERSPGLEPVYYVYNAKDQLVATQDPKQRVSHEWSIVKYDVLGRPVVSGFWTNNNTAISRANLQTQVTNHTVLFETRNTNAATHGYSNTAWPTAGGMSYTLVSYYDNYSVVGLPANLNYTAIAGKTRMEYPSRLGTVTKTWTDESAGAVLWTVNYYDDFARLLQSKSTNHLGGVDQVNNNYNFVGELASTTRIHSGSGGQQVTVTDSHVYDHAGRLLEVKQKINALEEITLVSYTYNELGELVDKKLHKRPSQTKFLQSVDYRYNERGWLVAINDPGLVVGSDFNDGDADSNPDLFGMRLSYNTDPIAPQYNGNIASMQWKTSKVPSQDVAPPQMGYQYRYDDMNRMTMALSEKNGTVDNAHSEYLKYDINGRINSLGRYAFTGNAKRQIDSLTYSYDGYRSTKIDDISTEAVAVKNLGYHDKVQQPIEHTYDPNGNMIGDLGKGISITYTRRNMPRTITFGTNHKLDFLYDHTGKKLKATYTNGAAVYTIDYIDGIRYEQNQLVYLHTAEGRARRNGSTYTYEYDLKDHLGSVRVTFRPDPGDATQTTAQVLQQNSYYPYGMPMYGDAVNNLNLAYVSGEKSKFLYSDKELYDQGGLNWFDHGSRMYDPAIGRWSAMDPAEQFANPYLAMGNNPTIFMDPNGEWIHLAIGAFIGGVSNWLSNGAQFNAKGLGYFGVGAVAGAIGAGVAGGVSSVLAGAGSSFGAGFMGTGAVAGTSFINGATIGASTGLTSGLIGGTGNGLIEGKTFSQAFGSGLKTGMLGAVSGGVLGGLAGGVHASVDGRRFWDGATVNDVVLHDQNIVAVTQNGRNNCLPASAESIDRSLGGNSTQNYWRNIAGGNADTNPLRDADFWLNSYGNNTNYTVTGTSSQLSNASIIRSFSSGNSVAFTTNTGGAVAHSVVLQRVTERTITKLTGRIINQYIYRVMDPAFGSFRNLTTGTTQNLNNLLNVFYIR
ncbi:hypothetical protein FAZ15_21320 [Sphingobacterium olei]|uniref:DUF6443 domain-containing protein n=1 Tax=Sphingobacterium olei TaxID=2571155 RepID=A0A4U0NKU3_9SPHI|nr:DUF6443 domain-containing protein [Sphingobacterium olei]TJZ50564.1 hypothetical protein FAZ15_21320 [Sphingobacterium olei]